MKDIKGTRYEQLLTIIDLVKPKTIIEIGTYDGHNAIRMIDQARKHKADITYIGYDLFEDMNESIDKEEFNVKPHVDAAVVAERLKNACPGTVITLIKGNTRETLKNPIRADLVFVDGGHSRETIANDYAAVKNSSVVVLDDFYLPDNSGAIPDTSKFGANFLVWELANAFVLPMEDAVAGGGVVAMAMLVNR